MTIPAGPVREPAVAGAFYPDDPGRLRALVAWQLAEGARRYPPPVVLGPPFGLLVPHAGLEYSGIVAAAAWHLLGAGGGGRPTKAAPTPLTVVILGTNHGAPWLDGIGAWDRGAWRTPLGDVSVDDELATALVGLGPPFLVELEAHLGEHSIEVQLPFLQEVAPEARVVPLAVSLGVGPAAIAAGARLGELLAAHANADRRIVLAISTDMAHYPSDADATGVTALLLPLILEGDAEAVADREAAVRHQGIRGLACGMCGIEPTVVGLAALRAAGMARGTALAAATSADAGGPADRTVGYLAAVFE